MPQPPVSMDRLRFVSSSAPAEASAQVSLVLDGMSMLPARLLPLLLAAASCASGAEAKSRLGRRCGLTRWTVSTIALRRASGFTYCKTGDRQRTAFSQ